MGIMQAANRAAAAILAMPQHRVVGQWCWRSCATFTVQQQAEALLRHACDVLELRVQERTAELAAARGRKGTCQLISL